MTTTTKEKTTSKDLLMKKALANIIVDTREQHSFDFNIKLPTNFSIDRIYTDKLDCGDYTISGYDMPYDDDSIMIERKRSLEEFAINISTHWERFTKQLDMLSQYHHPLIIIEDTLHNVYSRYKGRGYFKIPPNFLLKQIALIKFQYKVDTVFLGNRSMAQYYMCQLFKEIINKHE